MKKILFLTNATGIGGSEKVLNTILRKIDKEKYELSVFSISDEYEESFHIEGINLVERPPQYGKSVSGLREGLLFGSTTKDINFIISAVKYWVNCHLHQNTQSLVDWWNAYRKSFPVLEMDFDIAVAFGAGMVVPIALDKVNAKKKIAWINFDLQRLFDESTQDTIKFYSDRYVKFDRIVTVTQGNNRAFLKTFNKKIDHNKVRIIHDIIDLAQITELSQKEVPHEYSRTCNILTVGRLSPEKGYDLLIDAAKILIQRNREFRWYIVGNGEKETYNRKIVQEGLEENIILLGGKSNPYPYFRNCDIYVQTSLHEGNCLTLLEAMALGRPCVTTNFPTGIEKIEDGVNGLVVDMTAKSIADGVETLINNLGGIRLKYGENARQKIDIMSNELDGIYELFDSVK